MQVKDILLLAAEFTGRQDLADHFAGKSTENTAEAEREADTLLRCYNIAENEIALDYLPIRRTQEFASEGCIAYTAFEETPVEIISAKDGRGDPLAFTAGLDGVRVRAGQVCVTYAVRPRVKGLYDAPQLNEKGSVRLLALGTACEYALMSGMFEAAALLDKRYRDALACACRARNGRMRPRRWV